MTKTLNTITIAGLLFFGVCNAHAQSDKDTKPKAKSSIDTEILNTWNRTDQHVAFTDWPGKMKIKGNWGTVKEVSRVLKLYKADIVEPYASLYTKDEYMTRAFRQTRSILGSYTKKTSEEMITTFVDSPWAKRYMRSYYVKQLAKDCDVPLTEDETKALDAFETLNGPSPSAWVCATNPDLKELPLP